MTDQQPPDSRPTANDNQRLKRLLESAAYRPADADVEYLSGDDSRGVRLLLDYQKPESLMREQGIEDTIVVFGSTRIQEPAAAQRQVDERRQQLASNPGDPALQQQLKRAIRLQKKSHYYEVATRFGELVGAFGLSGEAVRAGQQSNITLVTGGGPGIMEAANRGAFNSGARNIGLNISLPHEQAPNPYITPELCFSFHYFATRKLHFLLRAKALVAFPGGYGTLDELFDTLTLIQTEKIAPLPVVLVGQPFWQQALNIPFLVDEGVIDSADAELFCYAESADEIWQSILNWHDQTGES
ncbi:MAG: LOG family protein [Immundisolibacteraceae bacterium]|nr:LOG family protein [Immundisolibacteraceae bacterium]